MGLESRVVEVSGFAVGVESGGVWGIERNVLAVAFDEVGVGDVFFAEGDGIGRVGRDQVGRGVEGKVFVGDEGPAECFFEFVGDGIGCEVFASEDEGDLAFAEFGGHIGEGFEARGIAHIMAIAARG